MKAMKALRIIAVMFTLFTVLLLGYLFYETELCQTYRVEIVGTDGYITRRGLEYIRWDREVSEKYDGRVLDEALFEEMKADSALILTDEKIGSGEGAVYGLVALSEITCSSAERFANSGVELSEIYDGVKGDIVYKYTNGCKRLFDSYRPLIIFGVIASALIGAAFGHSAVTAAAVNAVILAAYTLAYAILYGVDGFGACIRLFGGAYIRLPALPIGMYMAAIYALTVCVSALLSMSLGKFVYKSVKS